LVKKGSAGSTASTTRNAPASCVIVAALGIIIISATRAGDDRSCGSSAALAGQIIVGSAGVIRSRNVADVTALKFMDDSLPMTKCDAG
jgi:hypothetical protein